MIVRFLALAAPCDYCGVEAGVMCRRPSGLVLRQVHSRRLRLAAVVYAKIKAGGNEASKGHSVVALRSSRSVVR